MNSRGVSYISTLFLIHVLIILSLSILAIYSVLREYSSAQNTCRKINLEINKIFATHLNSIEKMNIKAKRLRDEEDRLKLLIQAARHPVVLIPLETKLKINQLEQLNLRHSQEKTFNEAHTDSLRVLISHRRNEISLDYKAPKLHIFRLYPHRIATHFERMPLFEKLQKFKVSWEIPEKFFIPDVIRKIFQSTYIIGEIKGSCVATIKKKGSLWQPRISAVH